MYLVEHAKRKELRLQNADPPILEGIPLYQLSNPQKRICEPVPPTPPTAPRDEGSHKKESLGDQAKPITKKNLLIHDDENLSQITKNRHKKATMMFSDNIMD
jgi:hypothetical protein